MQSIPVPFTVEAKSVEGAFAFEGENVADTSFKYTGNAKEVGLADAAGNKLTVGKASDRDTDVVVSSIRKTGDKNTEYDLDKIVEAGDYVVTLKGVNDYSGTATVNFTVDKIDLENDVFTINTVKAESGLFGARQLQDTSLVKVNGEALADNTINAYIVSGINKLGEPMTTDYLDSSFVGQIPAKLSLSLSAASTNKENVTGDTATASMLVVADLVDDFYYDEENIPQDDNGNYILRFETAKNEAFDPALLSAVYDDSDVPVDVTVTKDGEEVKEYTEPGTYNVHVEVAVPDDLAYGGSRDIAVTVISRRYSEQPKAFVSVDGKDVTVQNTVEYDGEAVEPVIAVKAGSATIDPADYTVTYTDEDGEAVESIVEPGKYYGHIDFGEAVVWKNGESTPVEDIDFEFEVTTATIHSPKADKDVYDMTGEAVTPKFTAYTGEDLDGLSVEIDPAKVGVTYYEAKLDKHNPWIEDDDEWVKTGDPIKASDLKKAGNYIAVVTVPADDPHFTGEIDSQVFQISEYATFSDVDAGSWYADAVYNANDLGYMTGIKGTDLFMPLADISRAELSKVFFNMAGQSEEEGVYFPSAFADVDGWAWYAQPVAWASEAGIVTGYDADTFAPMDKATREQVAVMLYRYAAAQGKDVTVEDADAALAAYKDADQVSDWAKEAMAWAVENGIFGVDTDELWANQNIQRAAVASIAVRFQPEALPEA